MRWTKRQQPSAPVSDSPPERDTLWSTAGVQGAWRFVNRVWEEFDSQPAEAPAAAPDPGGDDAARAVRIATHKLVKQVTEAIDTFRFNSGIARLYEFLNLLKANPAAGATPALLAARATHA